MSTSTRDDIRKAIFASNTTESKTISFFGQQVEVRQPSFQEVMTSASSDSDPVQASINMMMLYCYVPGTDEKVFEEADRDSLAKLPLNSDMATMQKTIADLSKIDVSAELKN